jgi:general secretion pathway protein D
VVGPREFHARLKGLLDELDRRQPQVLIEMTLVAVTFNDSLSLAVELANEETLGDHRSFFFSSFGISDIDLASGVRTLNPGGGLNGVIAGPNETPFLIRAIAARGDSRVITTPRIVVSDNTTATVANVEEAPFTSVNASNTVATTSFAGFESAGTTLTVTPHIAQGDHLSLDYSFNFSNFTGSGSAGVPPPRTTNTFSGKIAVPDGHTIIIGGMVTENEADAVTELPLLGRIPVLGTLFQSSERARSKSRIFAFIRPTILRDDRFADLRLISEREVENAALKNRDYPESEPLWMR